MLILFSFCQASPKRLKDTGGEGDSKADDKKSNAEAKANNVAGPPSATLSSQSESKAESKSDAPGDEKLTADKVRHLSTGGKRAKQCLEVVWTNRFVALSPVLLLACDGQCLTANGNREPGIEWNPRRQIDCTAGCQISAVIQQKSFKS